MTNNLDLLPDDAEDFYDHLGMAFGVSDPEWLEMRAQTVGELADWLRQRLGDSDAEAGACMTTLAFLRLRAGLGEDRRPGPAAPLDAEAPRALFKRLRAATGLELPQTRMTRRGGWLALALFLGLPLGLLANAFLHLTPLVLIALASWPLMILVMVVDAGRLPDGVRTLGELARATVPLNYAKLAQAGGAVRQGGLWSALTHLIADAQTIPSDSITRDTRLFATVH